jgi:hypothetical protein
MLIGGKAVIWVPVKNYDGKGMKKSEGKRSEGKCSEGLRSPDPNINESSDIEYKRKEREEREVDGRDRGEVDVLDITLKESERGSKRGLSGVSEDDDDIDDDRDRESDREVDNTKSDAVKPKEVRDRNILKILSRGFRNKEPMKDKNVEKNEENQPSEYLKKIVEQFYTLETHRSQRCG